MKLTWEGHSCFKVETNEGSVVLDPYQNGSVPGLADLDLNADLVLCSHEHGDHNAREKVHLTGKEPTFKVNVLECFHDEVKGAKRGKNKIYCIEAEGMKIVHMGDLGHELEDVSMIKNCDVCMIPIGGFYTIDAATAKKILDKVEPRVIVPMHYRSDKFGFDVIGTLDAFTKFYNNVEIYNSSSADITKDTKAQVMVLTPEKIA